MKLKNDLRVLFDGIFLLCLAVMLQGSVLYTLFFGERSFLLLFAQFGTVAFGLYGTVHILVSQNRITVMPEGISVKNLSRRLTFSWTEIEEIGFVDMEWRKPKAQYIYFSRHRLTSKHRDFLSANIFTFLGSGLFAAVAPDQLPAELKIFDPFRNTYKQCYLEGELILFYSDSSFHKARSSALLSNTGTEFVFGGLFLLTAYTMLGLNGLVPVNSLAVSVFYLLVLGYFLCFFKKSARLNSRFYR